MPEPIKDMLRAALDKALPPLVLIHEWTDKPEEGLTADDWPYPTTYTRSVALGELSERSRRVLNVTGDLPCASWSGSSPAGTRSTPRRTTTS